MQAAEGRKKLDSNAALSDENGSVAILHGLRRVHPHFSDLSSFSGLTGSAQSFAALYLGARPVWSQRIRQASQEVTMGSSSRAVAGARDERSAKLWLSDFGR